MKGKTVFITGASAGIGESCAEVFARAGARLILLARRGEKLEKLADVLLKKYGTDSYIIACDIRNAKQVEERINQLPYEWKKTDILINNAGLARGMSKIHEVSAGDCDEMIDTNIKGILNVSRMILPGMIERGEGIVINIGSIAGREVYPGGNIYCATKHAVRALSKAMVIDLNGTGIRVTNLEPSMVLTEFADVRFRGDREKANNFYAGYTPLKPEDVAEIALFAASVPKHVMIQDILVTPTDQASPFVINKRVGKSE